MAGKQSGGPESAASEAVSIYFALLSRFSVWLGSKQIPTSALTHRRSRDLLKLLALQPAFELHRERVLDTLWPQLEPRSAAAQLYKAIHYVRRALATGASSPAPESLLEVRNEIVRLSAPGGVHTDVLAFEWMANEALRAGNPGLLQKAASAYSGELLPADRYQEWTLERREALKDLFIELLLALGAHWQGTKHLAEAANAFRQVLSSDAAQEAAHRGLMWVYAQQGNRSRALRQFERCRNELAQEVGAAPSPQTVKLFESIRDGKLSFDQHETQPTRVLPSAVALSTRFPLVGRQPQNDLLNGLLASVDRGEGAVLLLDGPAGVGKTRLAQELLRKNDRPRHLLWGGSYEQEGQSSYAPVLDALQAAVRDDQSDAHLIPAELASAIPELSAASSSVAAAEPVATQSTLFAGVTRFLASRARQAPLVLVLDDMQAADRGSKKLVHYLARQAATIPMLLVAIWRSEKPGTVTELEGIINAIRRPELVHRLTLEPLSKDEHKLLLEHTVEEGEISTELASDLYRLSGGNPLFGKELILQLLGERKIESHDGVWRYTDVDALTVTGFPIPPSLQALLRSRMSSLPPAAVRLLQFVAVAGQEIPLEVLEEWSQLDEQRPLTPSVLDVLDDAIETGLLQERGFGFTFTHPLFREIVYAEMTEARRRALHGRAAAALEGALQAGSGRTPTESVAYHFARAGDAARAAHYLVQAGDRAREVFDHDSALNRYRQAADFIGEQQTAGEARARIYERIGDVYQAIGDVNNSLIAFREAIDVLGGTAPRPDSAWQHALHRKTTHAAVLTPDVPTASEHLQKAWALLGPGRRQRARMLITQALFDWHANQLEAAVEHAAEALELAETEQAPVEIDQACEMLAMAHLPLGNWDEAFAYELRRQNSAWSPEIVVAVDAHLCLYQFRLQGVEPYRQAGEFIERVAQQASDTGNLRCLAVCCYVLGSLAMLQGEHEEAASSLDRARLLHDRIGSHAGTAYTVARQVELLTVGAPESAWGQMPLGLELAESATIRDHCLMMMHTAGIRNRLAVLDLESARDLVRDAERHEAESLPCAVCSVDRGAAVAAYHLAAGDPEIAAMHIEHALQLADNAQNRLGRARVLVVEARRAAESGDSEAATNCLAEAVAIFRDLEDRRDMAQALRQWEDLAGKLKGGPVEAQQVIEDARRFLAGFDLNR